MPHNLHKNLLLTCDSEMTERPPVLGSLPCMAVTRSVVADVLGLVGVLGACGVHVQHTHGSWSSGRIPALKPGALLAGAGRGDPHPGAEHPRALPQALSTQ